MEWREGERQAGRQGGREGGREGEREGGREGEREEGRETSIVHIVSSVCVYQPKRFTAIYHVNGRYMLGGVRQSPPTHNNYAYRRRIYNM